MNTFNFAGLKFLNWSVPEAVQQLTKFMIAKQKKIVFTANADHITQLQKNEKFKFAYGKADIITADGMPIVWASRLIGPPLKARVTGADLFPLLCEQCALNNLSVFLLGAAPGVAQEAAETLASQYKGLNISGVYSPPLGFDSDEMEKNKIIELIQNSAPDFIAVAFGAPKQEIWISENAHHFSKGCFMGVGASIDFIAGVQSRAPQIFQHLNMEWLYRWGCQPRRLTSRYLSNFGIMFLIFKEFRQKFK